MQEPFHSIPLVWIIQEDSLANRLPVYVERGFQNLLSYWKSVFSRVNVIVFPDYTLPVNWLTLCHFQLPHRRSYILILVLNFSVSDVI